MILEKIVSKFRNIKNKAKIAGAVALFTLAGFFSSCSNTYELKKDKNSITYTIYDNGSPFSYSKKIEDIVEKCRKESTFGHQILYLESELLPEDMSKKYSAKAKKVLDEIVKKAKDLIPVKKDWTETETDSLLKVVHRLIWEKLNYKKIFETWTSRKGTRFFSKGLAEGHLDCDTFTFTYMSVLEAIGLSDKVFAVETKSYGGSGHVFFRFYVKPDKRISWESTSGSKVPEKLSNDKYGKTMKNYESLPDLTKEQLIAMHLTSMSAAFTDSNRLMNKEKDKHILYKFLAITNAALKFWPGYDRAYAGRAQAFDALGFYEKALEDINEAIKKNPNQGSYYSIRAETNFKTGKEDVEEDFNKAVSLEPDFFGSFFRRGCYFFELKEYKKAHADFDKAVKLRQTGMNYFFKGCASYYLKNYEECLKDFEKAKELGYDSEEVDYCIDYIEDKLEE